MHSLKIFAIVAALCLIVSPDGGILADDDAAMQVSPRGAQFRDLAAGDGLPVESGDVVTIHVHARLAGDGQPGADIYNTRAMGTPIRFVVGTDNVMPAWNDCVVGMRAGGRRFMVAPPGLAYGAKGVQDLVPADATIVLVVELVSIDGRQP